VARYEDTTQFERDVMTSMGYVWRGEGWQRGFSDNEDNMLVEAWVGGPPKKPEPLTNVFEKIADINKPISIHPENDDVIPFGDEAKKIYRDDANKAIDLASGITSDLERKMQETDKDIANVSSQLTRPQRTELEKASLNLVLSKLKVKQERLNVLRHNANKSRAHEEYTKYYNEEMFMAYDATSWRDNYRKENSKKAQEKRQEEQQHKIDAETARQRVSVLENEQREKENEVHRLRELEFAAEEARKVEAARKALFAKAGILDAPAYTPEKAKAATAALATAGAMVLNRAPGMLQLSTAAEGVLTTTSELAGSIAGAVWRGAIALAEAATVSTAGATVSALVMGFWPTEAGKGSDKLYGRDIVMFGFQANLIAAGKVSISPEMHSVDLPIRGSLVMENGQLQVRLVKTGIGGVPASVPILKAVRDEKTGLDRITLPAVGGAPSRTILINPAPVGPTAPPHTGNSSPVPVTPVHTGTTVKQADSIVTTSFPADDLKELQDFIYWQPDATGSGVEPIYVMQSDPLDSGRFTRKQLDKKFKHAIDFGISDTKKNRETLTKFRDEVNAHLADKETVERGTYRREKGSKVYFNPKSMRVVILKANGDFLSGWKINPDADNGRIYLETGDL